MGDPMVTDFMEGKRVLTLIWKIENISFYRRRLHWNVISSPHFTTRTSGTKWYLRLFRMGEHKGDQHIRIYLNLCNAGLRCLINCQFSIITGDGSPFVTRTVRNRAIEEFIPLAMPDCPMHKEVFALRKSAFLSNDTLTVRCRIWMSNDFKCSQWILGRSRIEVAEDSFQWPIKAFRRLRLEKKVTNEVDICIAGREISFALNFSLKGASLEEAVAQIELVSDYIDSELSVTLKVSVLDNEEKAITVEDRCILNESEDKQSWILPKFATRKELLAKKLKCYSGNVLTLLCQFKTVCKTISHFLERTNPGTNFITDVERKVSTSSNASCQTDVAGNDSVYSDASCQTVVVGNDSTFSNASSQTSQQSSDTFEQSVDSSDALGEDLLSMYQDHTGSDFELCSGDVSFPVHKQVLMARSPVFRAMFCSDMRESGTHSLEVPDVDAHTLNRMLTFLYAGTMDPDLQWEGAARLYYAADKYQVQSLKQRCSFNLQRAISLSNVGDILTLADRHQDQELTSFVHDFFSNNFNDIMLSDEWDVFHELNPSLAGITMKQVYKKKLQMKRSQ